jgi:hypothetical protein
MHELRAVLHERIEQLREKTAALPLLAKHEHDDQQIRPTVDGLISWQNRVVCRLGGCEPSILSADY